VGSDVYGIGRALARGEDDGMIYPTPRTVTFGSTSASDPSVTDASRAPPSAARGPVLPSDATHATSRCAPALALPTAALGGCQADTNLTNPNTQTVASFWKTPTDASQGLTATYNALNYLGTYLRWWVFASDTRSDIAYSLSPWIDLQNQSKFTFTSYNFRRCATPGRYLHRDLAGQPVVTYVPRSRWTSRPRPHRRRGEVPPRGAVLPAGDALRRDIPLITAARGGRDRPAPAARRPSGR
jgi:hypothetical protein